MPGFITRETLEAEKDLIVELFSIDFWNFAMTRPEGTPFLTAWAEFNL